MFLTKSHEVNTGFSDYDIDLLHDSMSIELINHEASETQFIGSKQFYGSCEDRFGNNFGEFNDQHIIMGKSKHFVYPVWYNPYGVCSYY